MRCRQAFTLVELLVVIAIISILAALLLPALEGALFQARLASCASQQKQIYLACQFYGEDNNDLYPFSGWPGGLWVTPPSTSLYVGSAHRYYGIGLLWRFNYLEDRQVMVDPDWNNPSPPLLSLFYNNVSRDGKYYWEYLAPKPGDYSPQTASTASSCSYVQFFQRYEGTKLHPRRISVTNPFTTAVFMCAMMGGKYPENGSHRKEFTNVTFEDGHVSSLYSALYVATVGAQDSWGISTSGNSTTEFCWKWAQKEDAK